MLATEKIPLTDDRHPQKEVGKVTALYVWPYPIRLFHWGMVISIAILSFTGYYVHSPFIVGQVQYPFMMGWFRFVHELFGMIFLALFVLRIYLFFAGNRWLRWRSYVPLKKEHFKEMVEVMKFYGFMRPTPISKIGHNRMAAFSYVGIYSLVAIEIITGLVMYNVLRHSAFLGFFVNWIPGFVSLPNLRLIHFFLMFVFMAFAVFHVHLCMLISREEKRGLMDSIFIGYKLIPNKEIEEEEELAIEEAKK
jgi:Ni/Fe-hydrogenase 1 B-type cytochrome subunit